LWLHSLKVAQLLRSAACLHTNQSRSYLNHLVVQKYFMGHKVWPAVVADSCAILTCVEYQSKNGSPTFHPHMNFHNFLQESFIVPLMVPSTSLSTIASLWLGLAIGSSTGLRRV